MPPSLTHRHLEPELMDAPTLPLADHALALRGLARINRWSGSADILWPPIRNFCRENPGRKLEMLDIATGAGDVPIQIWLRAKREGFNLDIDACDRSPDAIEIAREHAGRAGAAIRFFTHDATTSAPPAGYDVLTSSLFLHHLEPSDAGPFLRNLARSDARLVLINDLERSRAGLVVAWIGCRLLSRSPIVHADGPRSVRAAFTLPEVQQMAADAGMTTATVTRRWPFRFLLEWRR